MNDQHGALVVTGDQDWWDQKQLAALKQLGVGNASQGDLLVFLHQVQRTGLDPFARQIYMITRYSKDGPKATIQTGIDGFRLIGRRAADQRGEHLELSDTEWCGPDGIWRDVWLADEPPAAARVAVIRNGDRFPAVALYKEYAQTDKSGNPTSMWRTKAALMLAKCAEALAWRKAFPQDLSGLYTSDEMGQADNPVAPQQQRPAPPAGPQDLADVVAAEQQDMSVRALMARLGLDGAALRDFARRVHGTPVNRWGDLDGEEQEYVRAALAEWEATGSDPTLSDVVDAEVIDATTGEVQ